MRKIIGSNPVSQSWSFRNSYNALLYLKFTTSWRRPAQSCQVVHGVCEVPNPHMTCMETTVKSSHSAKKTVLTAQQWDVFRLRWWWWWRNRDKNNAIFFLLKLKWLGTNNKYSNKLKLKVIRFYIQIHPYTTFPLNLLNGS